MNEKPEQSAGPDPAVINAMFGRIAGRYDLVNRVMSGGIDIRWRRKLVNAVAAVRPAAVLDLATGSGDVAFALRRALPETTRITGMDFCRPMLDEAEKKRSALGSPGNLEFRFGDALDLPLADDAADAITIAFGLRNLADRDRGLREMRRVLKKNTGGLFILEFTQPARCIRPVYLAYLRHVLPRLAGCLSGDRSAYTYLNTSIEAFPSKEALGREIADAGFREIRAHPMTGSIVTLHIARA